MTIEIEKALTWAHENECHEAKVLAAAYRKTQETINAFDSLIDTWKKERDLWANQASLQLVRAKNAEARIKALEECLAKKDEALSHCRDGISLITESYRLSFERLYETPDIGCDGKKQVLYMKDIIEESLALKPEVK